MCLVRDRWRITEGNCQIKGHDREGVRRGGKRRGRGRELLGG